MTKNEAREKAKSLVAKMTVEEKYLSFSTHLQQLRDLV